MTEKQAAEMRSTAWIMWRWTMYLVAVVFMAFSVWFRLTHREVARAMKSGWL